MKRLIAMLFAALLALPAAGWSQEKLARAEKPQAAPPTSFSITSETVRDIVRATAREQSTATNLGAALRQPASDALDLARRDTTMAKRLALKFKTDRRVNRVECDALQCYAYSRDGEILFSQSRDPYLGQATASNNSDAWLSCQDNYDLLTTFERYDRCRGVGFGVGTPLQWNDGSYLQPATDWTRLGPP